MEPGAQAPGPNKLNPNEVKMARVSKRANARMSRSAPVEEDDEWAAEGDGDGAAAAGGAADPGGSPAAGGAGGASSEAATRCSSIESRLRSTAQGPELGHRSANVDPLAA